MTERPPPTPTAWAPRVWGMEEMGTVRRSSASDVANFGSLGSRDFLYGTAGEIPQTLEALIEQERIEEEVFREKQRRYDEQVRAEILLEKLREDADNKSVIGDDESVAALSRTGSQMTRTDSDRGGQGEQVIQKEEVKMERQEANAENQHQRWREKDAEEEERDRKVQLLSSTRLPRLLAARERDAVAEHIEVLQVGAHREVIIKQDRSAPALFMVCQGYCEGVIQGDNGVQVASRVLSPGDWFPLPTLSLDLPSPFTVTAQKCTLLRLPAAAFRSHLLPFVQADVGLQISLMRDIFAGLGTADAARLLSISKVHQVKPGTLLVEQGDAPIDLLILIQGQGSLWRDGKQISTAMAPHLFGEMSATCNMPSPVMAKASTMCSVLSLVKTDLAAMVREFASFKPLATSLVQGAVENVKWQMTRSVQTSSVSMSSSARRGVRAGEEEDDAEADPRGGGAASRAEVGRKRHERQTQQGSVSGWRPRSALARLEVQPASKGGGQGSGGAGGLVRQKTVVVKTQDHAGVDALPMKGTPIPSSFGNGIYANPASLAGSGSARPQSAFSHRMLSRRAVGKLVRPMSSQVERLEDALEKNARNRPITALRDVLGADASVTGNLHGKASRLNRSLKRSNEAQLESETVRFYKQSDAYLLHNDRSFNRALLCRLQGSAADRMRANATRAVRQEQAAFRDGVPVGTKAMRLRAKLEKTIGGFALRHKPDDVPLFVAALS